MNFHKKCSECVTCILWLTISHPCQLHRFIIIIIVVVSFVETKTKDSPQQKKKRNVILLHKFHHTQIEFHLGSVRHLGVSKRGACSIDRFVCDVSISIRRFIGSFTREHTFLPLLVCVYVIFSFLFFSRLFSICDHFSSLFFSVCQFNLFAWTVCCLYICSNGLVKKTKKF